MNIQPKHASNMDDDKEIKRKVQALDLEIPQELELSFLQKLQAMQHEQDQLLLPLKSDKKPFYYSVWAKAASILLLLGLTSGLLVLLKKTDRQAPANETVLEYARVEGVPAIPYVVDTQDKNITIIWVEKTATTAQNTTAENKKIPPRRS